ncbi:hypothetical protein YC2023_075958 [Brassica napus]
MASYVYQYFKLLKTIDGYEPHPSQTHIKKVKSLTRMKFGCLDFDSEQLCDSSQFSLALAVNILKFSVTKAIFLDFLYGFGDEKAFKEILDWLESASPDSNCLSSILSLSISLSHDESFINNATRVRFELQTEMVEEEKRLRCYLEPLAVALDKEKWSMCVYSK